MLRDVRLPRVSDLRQSRLQARIESSRPGRILISLFAACTVFTVLVVNMPDSELKDHLLVPFGPVLRASGLDQNWGVFSDVRTVSVYVEGRVQDADGSTTVTPIPSRTGISAFSDYRWQKYEEQVRLDDNKKLWVPYATWLADQARAQGRNPVRVSLVRRFADTLPPGPGPERKPYQSFTFFELPLTEQR
jgi:hypothetical protein